MSRSNHYTFGDTDLAVERLRLLAEVFEPSSRRFLSRLALPAGGIVLDLGCGPGYTTELLQTTLRPARTIGLEKSARLVALARARCQADLHFVEHDVLQTPFPAPLADVVYVRFLVTHLHEPERALRSWADAVRGAGRLVIEETAALSSADHTFSRYYALVERMQAHYGQRLYVGATLPEACDDSAWTIERNENAPLELDAQAMARLHALNIRSWGSDAFVRQADAAQEVELLAAALDAVASGRCPAPPVVCTLKQLVLRRAER
jgi:trans-aconitate 2-methyltransferase